jgi:hypothetical protein
LASRKLGIGGDGTVIGGEEIGAVEPCGDKA